MSRRVAPAITFAAIVLGLYGAVGACNGVQSDRTPTPAPETSPTASQDADGGTQGSPVTAPAGTTPLDTASVYVLTLRDSAYSYGAWSDAHLVDYGKQACRDLDFGESLLASTMDVSGSAGMDVGASAFLTGAAVAAFCPEHANDDELSGDSSDATT